MTDSTILKISWEIRWAILTKLENAEKRDKLLEN